MKNKELAKILLKHPENECIMGVYNGQVNTYSEVVRTQELPTSGVYTDMYDTIDGEIDMGLFNKLSDGKVTYIVPGLEHYSSPIESLKNIKNCTISWIEHYLKLKGQLLESPWFGIKYDKAVIINTVSLENFDQEDLFLYIEDDKPMVDGYIYGRGEACYELNEIKDIEGLINIREYLEKL